LDRKRPLNNVQFWPRSRKAKISTAGIYGIFRGLKFEPDKEIGQKRTLFKGLRNRALKRRGIRYGGNKKT
jgi:hypothetical protein